MDPLPPSDDDKPTPRTPKIVCEFCESQLAQSGDVLKLGNKAREYRDAERDIEQRTDTISKLEAQIAELRQQLEAAKALKAPDVAPTPAKTGWLRGGN